jgi:hypothetical protein
MLARQAGMSYGKWKAMQPIVPIDKKKETSPDQMRVCPYCGKQFKRSGKKIYCGDFCRNQHYYERSKEQNKNRRKRKKESAL